MNEWKHEIQPIRLSTTEVQTVWRPQAVDFWFLVSMMQAFINQAIQEGTHVWIGLSDILVERTWTWVDGTPLTLK